MLDGVQVWAVGWQKDQSGACVTDRLAHGLALVASQIVEHDDVAMAQCGDQALFDPCQKAAAVDGAIQDARGTNAIGPQTGDKGQRLPVAMRDFGDQALATRAPPADRRHVRLGPGLIDKDQARGVNLVLMAFPELPFARHVRTILFAGVQAFFYS